MVRKAVVPVAGLGTRFLPVTKSVAKEMLPIVDRPAVQYIVEECVRAGLDDVLFVTAAGKSSIEDYFDRNLGLEASLEAKGAGEQLALVRDLAELATIHSVRQGEALGLGHAVLMAANHVQRSESFAVLLGDDLLHPSSSYLGRMIEVHGRTGRPVVALMEVPDDQVELYGVATVEPGEHEDEYRITDLVEKPSPEAAPSNLAVIGRYVLPGAIFDVLRDQPPGRGNEIQLTDALQRMAAEEPIVGLVLREPRYDAGDKLGYLQANIELAAQRDDLGPPLVAWLRGWLAERDDASRPEAGA